MVAPSLALSRMFHYWLWLQGSASSDVRKRTRRSQAKKEYIDLGFTSAFWTWKFYFFSLISCVGIEAQTSAVTNHNFGGWAEVHTNNAGGGVKPKTKHFGYRRVLSFRNGKKSNTRKQQRSSIKLMSGLCMHSTTTFCTTIQLACPLHPPLMTNETVKHTKQWPSSLNLWPRGNSSRYKQAALWSARCQQIKKRKEKNKQEFAVGRGEVCIEKSSAYGLVTISDSSLRPVTQGRDGGAERKGGRTRGGERREGQKPCCRTHLFSILAGGRKAKRRGEREWDSSEGEGDPAGANFPPQRQWRCADRERGGREVIFQEC